MTTTPSLKTFKALGVLADVLAFGAFNIVSGFTMGLGMYGAEKALRSHKKAPRPHQHEAVYLTAEQAQEFNQFLAQLKPTNSAPKLNVQA